MERESSDDEDSTNQATAEERAVLKAIEKGEQKAIKESNSENSEWKLTVGENGSLTNTSHGNNIICENFECVASTAVLLCPKKWAKVEELSTITLWIHQR